jgi:hypothetical protein
MPTARGRLSSPGSSRPLGHRGGTEWRGPVATSRCVHRRDPCRGGPAHGRRAHRRAGSMTLAPGRPQAAVEGGGRRHDRSWRDSSCRATQLFPPARPRAPSRPPAPVPRPHTANRCTPPTRRRHRRRHGTAATRHATGLGSPASPARYGPRRCLAPHSRTSAALDGCRDLP